MTPGARRRRIANGFASVFGSWLAPLLIAVQRCSSRRAGVVLLYHAVGATGGPREPLVPMIPRVRFRRQLRHLQRNYEVVAADRFLDAVVSRRRGQRFPVSITLDDDLPEHAREAMPELLEASLPATFFLTGADIDEGKSTWWQRLQRAVDSGVEVDDIAALLPNRDQDLARSPAKDIHTIADAVIRLSPAEREEFGNNLLRLAGPDAGDEVLSVAEVNRLVAAGFSIGFHTRWHDPLTELDDAGLEQAMRENRQALEDLAGKHLRTIAYPHGYADERVARVARDHGFELGFTCERIAATPNSDPLLVGRSEFPETSQGVFAMSVLAVLRRTD